MTAKQRSSSFIFEPIDFSYTTSYRLSIATFALGLSPFSHNTFRTDRQTRLSHKHDRTKYRPTVS